MHHICCLLCCRHAERQAKAEYELVGQRRRQIGEGDFDSSESADDDGGGGGVGGGGSPAQRARAAGGGLRAHLRRVPSYWAIADGDLCGATHEFTLVLCKSACPFQ